MENNIQETPVREDTQVQTPAPEPRAKETERPSVRESLKENFDKTESPKVGRPAKKEFVPASDGTFKPAESVATPVADPIVAPASMNAQEKAAFMRLTPEMQQYVSRRDYETRSDYKRQTYALSEAQREIADISNVITPQVRQEYAREGIAVPQLVERAIAWDKSFKTNKNATALEYLQAYGVDLNELYQHQQGAVQEQPQYLTKEDVERTIAEQQRQFIEQQQQSQVAYQNQSAVQSFLGSKPVFRDPGTAQQIEEAMAPIVAGLHAANPHRPAVEKLEEAYNYVMKGHPVFSGLSAKQEADRKEAEAQKARFASRSISGSPGSGTPKIKANLRDNLRRRFSGG